MLLIGWQQLAEPIGSGSRLCPHLSSRARCCQVVDEVSVDDVGESPFEAAQRFEVCSARRALSPVVVLARAGHPVLHDGGDVQGVVEPAVAPAVEPVAVVVPARDVDGCGAGVAGEVRLGWEPPDVAVSARIFAALIGPTPLISSRVVRCSSSTSAQALLELLESGVEPLELTELVPGELLAGLPDRVAGPHRRQQLPGPGRVQMPFGATRNQLAEHVVQPVHGRDPLRDNLLTTGAEQAQDLDGVFGSHHLEVPGPQPVGVVRDGTNVTRDRSSCRRASRALIAKDALRPE